MASSSSRNKPNGGGSGGSEDGFFTSPFASPAGKKKKNTKVKSTTKVKTPRQSSHKAAALLSPTSTSTSQQRLGLQAFLKETESQRLHALVFSMTNNSHKVRVPDTILPHQVQGIWKGDHIPHIQHEAPVALWLHPKYLDDDTTTTTTTTVHGVWGYAPGVKVGVGVGDDDPARLSPTDIWCWGPHSKTPPPPNFQPVGSWTFPLTERKVDHLKEFETAFLTVGNHQSKVEPLDVGGTWRLLYKAGGGGDDDDDNDDGDVDKVLGPGIKPRTPKRTPSTPTPRAAVPTEPPAPPKPKPPSTTPKAIPRSTPKPKPPPPPPPPTFMTVHVNDPKGNRILTMDQLQPQDPLVKIQNQIQQQAHIPKGRQRLVLLSSNHSLKDPHKTLEDYQIQNGDTLQLAPMIIRVEKIAPEGKSSFPLTVTPQDRLQDVQEQIQNVTKIPIMDQRLEYQHRSLEEKDAPATLDDLGVQHGDVLRLLLPLPPKKVVHLKDRHGKTTTYEFEPTDSIQNLQERIQRKTKVPIRQQRLLHHSKPLLPDDDDDDDNDDRRRKTTTLDDLGIAHGDILEMGPMEIHVETPDGKSVPVIVTPTDTIRNLQTKIQDKLGIPQDEQHLHYQDEPLDDPQATLDDIGMDHGDVVKISPPPSMTIHVNDPSGNRLLTLEDVLPEDTLEDIQEWISNQANIPASQQRLSHKSKPLEKPRKTLKDYGIQDGDSVDLGPMEIQIETPEGTIVPLTVQPTDTIRDVQKQVRDKIGMPVDEQRLHYKEKPLQDPKKTLDDLGVKHGDVLKLSPGMKVNVQDPNGNTTTYDVKPSDTLSSLQEQVARQQGIPISHQQPTLHSKPMLQPEKKLKDYNVKHNDTIILAPWEILVQTPDGSVIPLIVQPTDTIPQLQKKIQSKTKIPVADQRLEFNEEPLDNRDDTLDDIGVRPGDTIVMEPMEVYVKHWNGTTTTIEILAPPSRETLANLSDAISALCHVPPSEQRLRHGNNPLPLSKKSKPLESLGIRHQDTIYLDPMEITVTTPDGKSIPMKVEPTDTIEDVKRRVADQEGIPIKDQRLVHKGVPLEDDTKTLEDCGIQHGDVLPLKPMHIQVKAPDGKVVTLPIVPSDTVEDVKDKIRDSLGIPNDEQRLNHKGKPLGPDRTTLADNGIQDGDVLDLEGMQIYVRDTKNNKKLPLDNVDPTNTIAEIKDRVEKEHGVPKKEQRLRFGTTPLNNDEDTLRDYGIQNNDTLDLGPMVIYAKMPNGSKLTLDVDPWSSTTDLKQIIEKKSKVPASIQTLEFQDEVMPDPKTLDDLGIAHGDTIYVKKPATPPTSPVKRTPSKANVSTPKKKSYLPANWKEDRDRYGEIITTYYEIDHNVDEGENFIRGKTKEEREKFKMTSPRRSPRKDGDDD